MSFMLWVESFQACRERYIDQFWRSLYVEYKKIGIDVQCQNHGVQMLGKMKHASCHPLEYACMVKITEKSDVYSFGVVLLEIITGKRPCDQSFPEGQQHVIQWVMEHLKSKKDPIEVLDPKLQGHSETQIQEMLQALGISLLCTSYRADDRPTMKDVAALLREIRHDPPTGSEPHRPKKTNSSSSIIPAQLMLLQSASHSSSLANSSSSAAAYHPPRNQS